MTRASWAGGIVGASVGALVGWAVLKVVECLWFVASTGRCDVPQLAGAAVVGGAIAVGATCGVFYTGLAQQLIRLAPGGPIGRTRRIGLGVGLTGGIIWPTAAIIAALQAGVEGMEDRDPARTPEQVALAAAIVAGVAFVIFCVGAVTAMRGTEES